MGADGVRDFGLEHIILTGNDVFHQAVCRFVDVDVFLREKKKWGKRKKKQRGGGRKIRCRGEEKRREDKKKVTLVNANIFMKAIN